MTFLRIALGAATLACFPAARRGAIEREDRGRVVLLGVLWVAIPFELYPIAQQWIDSAVAGMITGSAPLFSALVAAILLRRAPTNGQIAGLVCGFAGVVAIGLSAAEGTGSSAAGIALIVAAVACYGVATNIAVPLQQRYGSLAISLRILVVALVFVTGPGIVGLAVSSPEAGSLAAMVPLGIGATGLAFVAFTTLIGRAGPTRGPVAVYFVPVVALILGVTLGSEHVGVGEIAGCALVIAGAWVTSQAARRPGVQAQAGAT